MVKVVHDMLSASSASTEPTSEPVVLEVKQLRRHVLVKLPADRMMQLTDISQLCKALDEVVDGLQMRRPQVLLSFAGVQYISSTFLGRLMGLHKRLVQRGGRLKVADMLPTVREAFCLTQMQRTIPLYRSSSEALANRSTPWLVLLALTCVNALLGLRGLMSLASEGWFDTTPTLDNVALACFIAYIPLPVAILLTRGRFVRLEIAFQWTLVALFLFVTLCALPAYLTAGQS